MGGKKQNVGHIKCVFVYLRKFVLFITIVSMITMSQILCLFLFVVYLLMIDGK